LAQTGSVLYWQKLAVYSFETNVSIYTFGHKLAEDSFDTNWQYTLGHKLAVYSLAQTGSILFGTNWQCTLLAETDLLDCSPQENETIEFPLLFLCILPFQQHRSVHKIEYNKLEKN
jgi:hypothetical protein